MEAEVQRKCPVSVSTRRCIHLGKQSHTRECHGITQRLWQHGCSSLRQSPCGLLTSMQQPGLLHRTNLLKSPTEQRPIKGLARHVVAQSMTGQSFSACPCQICEQSLKHHPTNMRPTIKRCPPRTSSFAVCLPHAPDSRSNPRHCRSSRTAPPVLPPSRRSCAQVAFP